MKRLYRTVYDGNLAKRGELLIETEHSEAIAAVIKALKLTHYIYDEDALSDESGQVLVNGAIRYQTTFGED